MLTKCFCSFVIERLFTKFVFFFPAHKCVFSAELNGICCFFSFLNVIWEVGVI